MSAMGISFPPVDRREILNRCSLAMFDHKEIAYPKILPNYNDNSKAILWGNLKITMVDINFHEILWRHLVVNYYPPKFAAVASLHSTMQNYPA